MKYAAAASDGVCILSLSYRSEHDRFRARIALRKDYIRAFCISTNIKCAACKRSNVWQRLHKPGGSGIDELARTGIKR